MRILFGILIGICLTIGATYISDSTKTGPEATAKIVNWEIVREDWAWLNSNLQDGWARLTGHSRGT